MHRIYLSAILFIFCLNHQAVMAATSEAHPSWPEYTGYRALDVNGKVQDSLWQEERTPQKTGTIILLPNWGERPTNADSMQPLRQTLPNWGWQTIAIVPPEPQQRASILSGQDTQAISTYQQQLLTTLQAITQAQGEPFGYQVVVAQGVMAAWVLRIYNQQQLPLPNALVLISSYFPNPSLNDQIAQQISELTIPVYDIYYQQSNRWSIQGAHARLIETQRRQKSDYRQSEILSAPYLEDSGQLLAKQLYGWFNALGWY
ncbi:DUF3530 family protein [Celerinatantimonas sp. YJH-8]|uniref:DUF3530 family protein n=1 Tax=Celerinatantimonas sp. YJH-8 TaxID=3228714 RepID=UPI0038C7F97C